MKRIILLTFFICSCTFGWQDNLNKNEPLDQLIFALVQVESGGNINAIGDNGKAFGILQIHEIMVEDFNRIAEINDISISYSHEDVFDPEISIFICKTIFSHYGKRVIREKGQITFEDLARIWNAGGSGWKDFSSSKPLKENNLKKYWHKAKEQLNKDF